MTKPEWMTDRLWRACIENRLQMSYKAMHLYTIEEMSAVISAAYEIKKQELTNAS